MKDYKDTIAGNIPYLRRYARALTGDSELADRLVFECINCAMDLCHLLKDHLNGEMKLWLFTVFHNFNSNEEQSQSDPGYNPDDLSNMDDQGSFVDSDKYRKAIQRLPLNERQTFLLVTLEQFSYADVSRILNLPMGAVLSQLHSARRFMMENTSSSEHRQGMDGKKEGSEAANTVLEIFL